MKSTITTTCQRIKGRTVHFYWTPKKRFVLRINVFGYGVTASGQYSKKEAEETASHLCDEADRAGIYKM